MNYLEFVFSWGNKVKGSLNLLFNHFIFSWFNWKNIFVAADRPQMEKGNCNECDK